MGRKTHEDELLGLDCPITRRDFVGSTLLASGSALLGMHAPSLFMPQAHAQGLDGAWTGPGGIGDYAESNGDTAEVVNAAHAIRDGAYPTALEAVTDTGETYDLVIVGGGFAGLSAAYTFNKSSGDSGTCLILDNHPIFGGEAKQNEFEVDGHHLWAPQGSNGCLFPISAVKETEHYHHYWQELGLPEQFEWQTVSGTNKDLLVAKDIYSPMYLTWESADQGYFYEDGPKKTNGWVIDPWNTGFRDAPISDSLKRDYLTMDLYRQPPRRADWKVWLDSMTYGDFLTKIMRLSPEVCAYLDPQIAVTGTGLGCDVISAYAAYLFAQPGVSGYIRYETGSDMTDWLYLASFPGGNTGIARYFVKALIPDAIRGRTMSDILFQKLNWSALDRAEQPVRMRSRATVIRVEHDGDPGSATQVNVVYARNGQLYRVTARGVVVASGQWVNKHIVKDLPSEYRSAMDTFNHGAIFTVNVAVRNWKFMERLGITSARWFGGFGWFTALRRNMIIDGKEPMPLDPNKPTVLTFYVPFQVPGLPLRAQADAGRNQLFSTPYIDFERQIRTQLTNLFAAAGFDPRRDIAGIVLNRWGHAFVVPQPGFYFGKDGNPAPRDILRKRLGRIAFGHSELTGQQGWTGAAIEGERAAKQIIEIL